MTLLEAPTALTHGGAFEYADLSLAGVHLAPEQLGLLTDSLRKPVSAIGVASVQHPQAYDGAPLTVLDHDGTMTLQLVPMAFSLAPEDWQQVVASDEALRFPSVAACELLWDDATDPYRYESLTREPPQLVRLWNLWPVSAWDVDVVLEALSDWAREVYRPLELYYLAEQGVISPCQAVTEALEHPVEVHRHGSHPSTDCWDGAEWLAAYHGEHFEPGPDGQDVLLRLPEVDLPPELMKIWRHLSATSSADSTRALSAIPSWKRQDIINSERKFSPWLWLS